MGSIHLGTRDKVLSLVFDILERLRVDSFAAYAYGCRCCLQKNNKKFQQVHAIRFKVDPESSIKNSDRVQNLRQQTELVESGVVRILVQGNKPDQHNLVLTKSECFC